MLGMGPYLDSRNPFETSLLFTTGSTFCYLIGLDGLFLPQATMESPSTLWAAGGFFVRLFVSLS